MSTLAQSRKEYQLLLADPNVQEWQNQLRSPKTARLYLNGLNVICKTMNVTPKILLANTPEQNEELLDKSFELLIKDRNKNRVADVFTGINSFLRYYNKRLNNHVGDGKDQFGRFKKKKIGERVFDWLLEYDCINYWIDDYTNPGTRRRHLSVMSRFCKLVNITPDQLLEMPSKQIKVVYTKAKQHYLKEGKTKTAKEIYTSLKGFLEAHEIPIHFRRRDKVRVEAKKAKYQHIPTKDEMYLMADHAASVRNRAIILLMFQAGLRTNAVRKLTYGVVKNDLYPKLKVPVYLKITPEIDTKISKYNHLGYYYTFLQDEASEALRCYVEWRKEKQGWIPEDDDFVFVPSRFLNEPHRKWEMNKDTIHRMVKRTAKTVGLDYRTIWPHLFRKSFRKILYQSPIDPDMAEALMGHTIQGSKENYFDREDLEWIAGEYMKCPFSREGIGRLDYLQKENVELKDKLDNLEGELGEIRGLFEKVKKHYS